MHTGPQWEEAEGSGSVGKVHLKQALRDCLGGACQGACALKRRGERRGEEAKDAPEKFARPWLFLGC